MAIQRYIEGGYGASDMEEDVQGDWVKHDDYAALETKLLAIHSHLERAAASQFNSKGYVKMALRIIEEEFNK